MEETCKEHSGCDSRISRLERNQDEELFPRLRELEKYAWQQSARTGLITGAVVLAGQALIQHYVR